MRVRERENENKNQKSLKGRETIFLLSLSNWLTYGDRKGDRKAVRMANVISVKRFLWD